MKPNSASATALHVADLCLARYAAEHVWKAKGPGSHAASLGTSVHGALEIFVKYCYIDRTHEPSSSFLIDLFKMSYMKTFDTVELGEGFDSGVEMLTNWYNRTSFDGVTVISCEQRSHFMVPTSIGEIPFNYIWDRFDRIGEREYKVVDYKSSVWGVNPADLKKKIQPRAYGLAAAIQLKTNGFEYDKIWVEFDMLRHDPVGIVYSREEITETWNFIRNILEEKIIPTPADNAPETLNPECRFCIRKQVCRALVSNIAAGGVFGLEFDQIIDRRAALEFQKAGIAAAIAELDEVILAESRDQDQQNFFTEQNEVYIGLTNTKRRVNADQVEMIVGQDLFEQYGAKLMAVGQWEKLCKDSRLTEEQRRQLKSVVYKPPGDVAIKVRSRSAFDTDH